MTKRERSDRAYKHHCKVCGKSPSNHPNPRCAEFQPRGCTCTDATCAFCVRKQKSAERELVTLTKVTKERAHAGSISELTIEHPALDGYPTFYLFHLGGSRYTLVSTGIHRGAGFGYLEGETLHLYGKENFQANAGLAWGKYNLHDAAVNGVRVHTA